MRRDLTIYDIAKALDLSPSTVSRALNENKVINSKTRERVLSYAREKGYQSNTFAANLRKNETHTIGVIVPKLDSKFISTCLAGAEKVASEKGYNLLISQSLEKMDQEISRAKTFFRKRVDALMVSLTAETDSVSHFNPFLAKGTPLVFFDRVPPETEAATFVIDNYQAAFQATQHLLQQNCACLMHITLNAQNLVYKERKAGFADALKQATLSACGQTLYLENLDLESGKHVAQQIMKMKNKPDGIFAANDQTAIGCMLELQRQGIKIPEDIAVVGFNNDPLTEIISPGLTTINYPAFDLGTMAANHLIEHMLGNANLHLTQKTVLKSALIIRKSTVRK